MRGGETIISLIIKYWALIGVVFTILTVAVRADAQITELEKKSDMYQQLSDRMIRVEEKSVYIGAKVDNIDKKLDVLLEKQ